MGRFSLIFALLGTSCVGPEDVTGRTNQPPRAALRAPVIAPTGDGDACNFDEDCSLPRACDTESARCRVFFDAACADPEPCVASTDLDGDPLTFIFQFNDGTAAAHSPDSLVFHTFANEGVYTVLVEVIDIHGASSQAAQDVSIRSEYPNPPDFCDEFLRPCIVGDACIGGVCYTDGGTL